MSSRASIFLSINCERDLTPSPASITPKFQEKVATFGGQNRHRHLQEFFLVKKEKGYLWRNRRGRSRTPPPSAADPRSPWLKRVTHNDLGLPLDADGGSPVVPGERASERRCGRGGRAGGSGLGGGGFGRRRGMIWAAADATWSSARVGDGLGLGGGVALESGGCGCGVRLPTLRGEGRGRARNSRVCVSL